MGLGGLEWGALEEQEEGVGGGMSEGVKGVEGQDDGCEV